jgi:hypothetical protein
MVSRGGCGPALKNFRLGKTQYRAIHELFDLCRREKIPSAPGDDAGRFPFPQLVLPGGQDGREEPARGVETNLRRRVHRRSVLVARLRFLGRPPCPAGWRSYFYPTNPCRASPPPRTIQRPQARLTRDGATFQELSLERSVCSCPTHQSLLGTKNASLYLEVLNVSFPSRTARWFFV